MNAIILSIGDELVLGQTVDTNSAWLSQQLAGIGCDIRAHKTVPDDRNAIAQAIREEAARCDVLIISGGLGPTDDDLTRDALADVLSQPLEPNQTWTDHLRAFFTRLGRNMPERNLAQAMLPRDVEMIWNHHGTAPGLHATIERESRNKTPGTSNLQAPPTCPSPLATDYCAPDYCNIFIMPGVPGEMKPMFTRSILPILRAQCNGAVILQTTLHTFGVGESSIAERLGDLMKRDRNPSVGTTVAQGMVSLRVNARFGSRAQAEAELQKTITDCRRALDDLIFGQDDHSLAQVVARLLIEHPVARRWAPAVCTAESCTGGLLAKMFTDIPGSSAYFRQGWITYDNEAKRSQLNVSQSTLDLHGAVSEPTVREMALGAAAQSGAPYALAISGVAGPSGGTEDKPVGTVCIALSYPDPSSDADRPQLGVDARTFRFIGDREAIRDRSAKMALTLLRYHLLGKPFPL